MTTNIVLTQDVPGERDWLKLKFPYFKNFETASSGHWPTIYPVDLGIDTIWEIPPESDLDLYSLNFDKILSLYNTSKEYRWCDSNRTISDFSDYTTSSKSNYVQVLTMMRCGTKFLESILYKNCNYQTASPVPLSNGDTFHAFTGDTSHDLNSLIKKTNADVFVCYRENWWEWITSHLIGQKLGGYVHYDTNIDWDKIEPAEISEKDLAEMASMAKYGWDSVCNLRLANPNLNFYIIEFKSIVAHQTQSEHRAVRYDKNRILKNYSDMNRLFNEKYLPKLNYWRDNAFTHLKNMKCQFVSSIEQCLP